MRFENRRVLLTGGSGALGALIAEELTARNARLTVLDLNEPKFKCAGYIAADLSTPEGIDAAAEKVGARSWDVLINLAGVQSFGPLEAQSAESLYRTYLINLVAPARLAQAVLPAMKRQGSGRIVNIGSIFGSISFAHFASYSSSKAGLRSLSQALRRELAGSGVGVTYVAPRAVKTPLNSQAVLQFAQMTGMAMDDPERIARLIVEAIETERTDVYLGFPESLFVHVNALFPRLVDRALRGSDDKARTLFHPHPKIGGSQ
jgi:short-subunit dehydrogenase